MIETARAALAAADPAVVLALVAGIAFVTGLGLPGPASPVLVLAGTAAALGAPDFGLLMAAATCGATAGDIGGHAIGRGGAGTGAGRRLAARPRLAAAMGRAGAFLQRRGLAAVFLSRWLVPPLGPWVSLAAGAAGVAILPFAAVALAGRLLWAGLYGGLGFGLGEAAEAAAGDLTAAAAVLAALLAGMGALALARPLRR